MASGLPASSTTGLSPGTTRLDYTQGLASAAQIGSSGAGRFQRRGPTAPVKGAGYRSIIVVIVVPTRRRPWSPPECGWALPPAVPSRHSRSAGGLHPVQVGAGEDPGAQTWPGTTQEAGQSCGRQGLQQRSYPRVPATAGNPPHHPGGDRQPGGPPAQRRTWRTASWLRCGPLQEAQHRRAGDQPREAVRAIATRYDKRSYVFLGTATAASVAIWLRT